MNLVYIGNAPFLANLIKKNVKLCNFSRNPLIATTLHKSSVSLLKK